MREVKYKAFDKLSKIFFNNDEITIRAGKVTFLKDDDWFPVQDKDIVLVQHTGLKDKNGVEIYEGDIVSFFYKGSSYTNMPIYFENQGFKTDNGIVMFLMDDIKVIGNIYENKDLLK